MPRGRLDLPEKKSAANSSVEVYYGGASVAVPFTWESQPGTPKVKFQENPLPPLSPPPSFNLNSPTPARKPKEKHSKRSTVSNFFLPKFNLRKTSHPPSPASSSSSRSSSRSVSSSNMRGQFELPSSRSPFDSRIDGEDECGSPVSTLCFGIGRGGANAAL